MKRRRIIIIILIVLFIVFVTVLRERGVFEINYYSSSIKSSLKNNWTVNHMTPSDTTFCSPRYADCIPKDFSQVLIITSTPDGIFKFNNDSREQLHFDLTYNNHGLFWMPFYKDLSFSASATCNDELKQRDTSSGHLVCKVHQLHGDITVTGHIKVKGLCSYREVKRLITNELVRLVQDIGKKQLQEL
jgi:hypothetical protein